MEIWEEWENYTSAPCIHFVKLAKRQASPGHARGHGFARISHDWKTVLGPVVDENTGDVKVNR